VRLSHTFRLHEKINLQLLAEVFNITNRTNYASVCWGSGAFSWSGRL